MFSAAPDSVLDAFTVPTPVAAWAARACPTTLRRWVSEGKLAAKKSGRCLRFRPRDVRELVRTRTFRRAGYGASGPRRAGEWYTAAERDLLRSDLSHTDVAARLGRSYRAVVLQRVRMRQGKTKDRTVIRRARQPRPLTIPGKWFVTPHAVRRYQSRVGETSYEHALAALIRLSYSAHRVRPLRDGCALYRSGRPLRLRFVVSEKTTGGLPQLLTVYAR